MCKKFFSCKQCSDSKNKCDYLKIIKNDYEDSKKITLNNDLQNKIKNNMYQNVII